MVEELHVMLEAREIHHPLIQRKALMVVVISLEIIQVPEAVRLLPELMVVVLLLQEEQAQQLQLMQLQQHLLE